MKNIFIFKTLALLVYSILLPFASLCQSKETGQPEFPLSINGFRQIKLGADIKRLRQDKLGYLDGIDSLDNDSCYRFCYKDNDLLGLGDGVSLDLIGLRTYKDKIVNIYLFFPRSEGHAVLRFLLANYGKFTEASGDFMYHWRTNGVTLSLIYKPNIDMGVAIFTSTNLEKELAEGNLKRKIQQLNGKNLFGSL